MRTNTSIQYPQRLPWERRGGSLIGAENANETRPSTEDRERDIRESTGTFLSAWRNVKTPATGWILEGAAMTHKYMRSIIAGSNPAALTHRSEANAYSVNDRSNPARCGNVNRSPSAVRGTTDTAPILSAWRNGRRPEASELPAVVSGHREAAGSTNAGSNPAALTTFLDRRTLECGTKAQLVKSQINISSACSSAGRAFPPIGTRRRKSGIRKGPVVQVHPRAKNSPWCYARSVDGLGWPHETGKILPAAKRRVCTGDCQQDQPRLRWVTRTGAQRAFNLIACVEWYHGLSSNSECIRRQRVDVGEGSNPSAITNFVPVAQLDRASTF